MKSIIQITVLTITLGFILIFITQGQQAMGQAESPPPVEETEADAKTDAEAEPVETAAVSDDQVEINWFEKLRQGGFTIILLLFLSVTGVASFAERLLAVRAKRVVPDGLADRVVPLIQEKNFEGVHEVCRNQPSTLSRVIDFVVDHRENPVDTISANAGDIAGREIRDMLARTAPLAVVASLAPLLGLLGTMIGMIEAFELVSIYGDDGGASMLAGSIAKALITTAVGLMIAIPAVAAHQYIKHRINHLTNALESDTEAVISQLYLKRSGSSQDLATDNA